MDYALCRDRIDQMGVLVKGWNGYAADPPNAAARGTAKGLCAMAYAYGPDPDRVEPTAMGGVGVTFGAAGAPRRVYVECYNDDTVRALFADDPTATTTRAVGTELTEWLSFLAEVRDYLVRPHHVIEPGAR